MKPEVKAAIERMIDNRTIEEIVSALNKPTSTVSGQSELVRALLDVRDARFNGNDNVLANEICNKQLEKVQQYGAKAFKLTERQLLVIAKAAKEAAGRVE